MGDIFSGSEIAELGVQVEVNGRDFYGALTKRSKNKKAKVVFKMLASEEEKHIAKFRRILDYFHKYEPKEAYPTEYFSYLNSLASECVFTQKAKGAEIAKNTRDDKDAIELGIGFERDSIRLYEGMKKVVPTEGGPIVDILIKQEEKHLKKLEALKEEV